MKTIALFNHRRGVGKTTLAYHLAWMMRHLGERVLAVDLDPQADLTAAFLDDDEVQALWNPSPSTIYGAVRSLIADRGHASSSPVKAIADGLSLIPGDLTLSWFEEYLALAWPKGTDRDPSTAEDALRVTTVFHRIIARATAEQSATLAILDLGPSLDALNRAALLAADAVIVPLIIDPTALRGLSALGTKLAEWRTEWTEQQRVPAASGLDLPVGAMPPLGYTVLQLSGADSSLLP
ncbi:MAG TPA: ParA family protein, partial [Kofleriaceae bacterium]|nr:ParA family protein [Kofleriaceae bacterium]